MKKLLLLTITFFFSSFVMSQINHQDSTVHVVAYWSKGDKYTFDYKTEKMKINEADTLDYSIKNERFSLEVIDSTATGYILEYKTLKITEEGVAENDFLEDMDKVINENFKDLRMLIQTDENGTYQGLANQEEVMEAIRKFAELLKPRFLELLPDSIGISGYDKEDSYQKIIAPLFNEGFLESTFVYVLQLIRYHGLALSMTDDIYWEEERVSPYDNSPIEVQCEVWTEDIDDENELVAIYNNNVFNSDQLINSYLNYMGNAINLSIPNNPERPYIYIDEIINVVIHVNSGWTTNTFYRRASNTGKVSNIIQWTVDMVFDE